MGTMTITSSLLYRQAEYQNTDFNITLNYQVDEVTKALMSIDGTLYKGEDKEYAGRFNGRPDGDEITYDTSGVKLADLAKLQTALTDTETQIKAEFSPIDE